MEVLKKDIIVQRIYFLSDIHIKNDESRNDEYYSVFKKLFNFYKKEKVCNKDLIVITGDIMDNGFAVSGNAIEMAKYLYVNLAEFCPVLTILGNHDYKTKVDTLTPIVQKHLNTKNEIFFLLDNEIYIYGNIAFGHTKFDTDKVISCKKYNKDYVTIALYHGMLKGSKLDNDVDCRSNFLLSNFKDYKYCAFGDIHKMQYLRKDKTAFYTGSLIAQKRSEDAFIHGTMKLDVKKDKVEFIEIPNDYKILDLVLDDDGKVSNYDFDKILKTTKYANLQITFGKYNEKMINAITDKFMKNGTQVMDIVQKPLINSLSFDTVLKVGKNNFKLSDVKDRKGFVDFLLKYIKLNHKIDNEKRFIKNVNTLMDDLNMDNLKIDDLMKQKRDLKILNIEMNNIMIYGNNVKVNIDSFTGITGLYETNSSGKSSLCELLSLVLFSCTPRCKNAYSFIRNGQKEASGTIRLISNNIEYEITRSFIFHSKSDENSKKVYDTLTITKHINKKKYVKYVKIDKTTNKSERTDKKDKNIEYKSKEFLENLINNEIITYDELYQMLVISQNREKSFLEEKNKDELLFKMANLSYLNTISVKADELYSSNKKNIKDMIKKYCSKDFIDSSKKTDNYIQVYKNSKTKLDEFEKIIIKHEEDKEIKGKEIKDKYINKNNQLITLTERVNNYKDYEDLEDYNLDELNEENKDMLIQLDKNKLEIKELDKNISLNDKKIQTIKKKLLKFKNMEEENQKFEQQQKKIIGELNKKLLFLHKNIKDIQYENITKKENDKYVKDKKILEKKLGDNLLKLEKYKTEDKMINTIIQIKNVIKEYETYLELNNEKIKIESNIEFIEENESYIKSDKVTKNKILKIKEEYQQKLNKVNKDLDKLKEVKDNYELIKKNVDHRDKIKLLDTTINTQQTLLNEYSNKINDYEQNKINKTYLDEIKELEEKISEEEDKELEKYNEYSQLLKDIDILEKEQYSIKLQKEKLLNNITKSENYIKDNQIILDRINLNKDNYDKYCEIKKEFDTVKKEFQIIEKEYNESNKLVEKNDIKMGELKEQCIIAKNILKKCEDTINDIKDFELLVNIFKNNGLCDKLLKDQIIVNLQKAIDDICTYIGHEKIYIILESSPNNISKKYNIIIKTDKIKDIANSGGFQKNIIELIFKLAFLRINSYFNSDFIIIDEIFDACSEDNKPMTIKLLEYFKTQYKKILLVSHNQSIVNLFDQRLTITHDMKNGNSIIQK